MGKKKLFVNKKIRTVDGIKVNTVETEIASPYNALTVEVGTTGKFINQSSKNSRLYLKIADALNSNISITKDSTGKGFILRASGNCEITTLIEALDFCSAQLKNQFREDKTTQNNSSPATLKQINLIKYLISQNEAYAIKKLPEDSKSAGDIIDFLKSTENSIPSQCLKYIKRKEWYVWQKN